METFKDPDTGRPIYIGDGIMKQIEESRKFVYDLSPLLNWKEENEIQDIENTER